VYGGYRVLISLRTLHVVNYLEVASGPVNRWNVIIEAPATHQRKREATLKFVHLQHHPRTRLPGKKMPKRKQKRIVNRVGFEPTQISLLAPEASALDRSADVMLVD
jgi:hypothetical protein